MLVQSLRPCARTVGPLRPLSRFAARGFATHDSAQKSTTEPSILRSEPPQAISSTQSAPSTVDQPTVSLSVPLLQSDAVSSVPLAPRNEKPPFHSRNSGSSGHKSNKKHSWFAQVRRLIFISSVFGIGYFGYSLWDEIYLPEQKQVDPSKPRLIVVGSGWGSVAALKSLDISNYNVTVISARNYFLFTPLLPSTATGLIEHRSIMEPTRHILRKKPYSAAFIEGEVTKVDPYRKTVTVSSFDNSHKNSEPGLPRESQEIAYDKLILGVGATTNTFGIKGVQEYACFLKEIEDTQKIRRRIMDCMEAASLPGLSREVRRRLMHAVVVGAGPTGVEFAGELHDFVHKDMRKYNPEVVRDFRVSLIEGMPQILPSGFSKQLVNYAIDTMENEQIDIMTKTTVTGADSEKVYATRTMSDGSTSPIELEYGTFVWAGGSGVRSLIKDLFTVIPEQAQSRRGLKVDEYLRVKGVEDIWAVGDCADAGLAPTAQVASQEGVYVGKLLNRLVQIDNLKMKRSEATSANEIKLLDRQIKRASELAQFKYSHQGSLAYIGSDKALADLQWYGRNFTTGGTMTYIFWRSAYLSMVFSLRNKLLVALDWTKVLFFGRDISRE